MHRLVGHSLCFSSDVTYLLQVMNFDVQNRNQDLAKKKRP
jgi:hypothetical protein